MTDHKSETTNHKHSHDKSEKDVIDQNKTNNPKMFVRLGIFFVGSLLIVIGIVTYQLVANKGNKSQDDQIETEESQEDNKKDDENGSTQREVGSSEADSDPNHESQSNSTEESENVQDGGANNNDLEEDTDSSDNLKTCTYEDDNIMISFQLDRDWQCVQNDGSTDGSGPPSTLVETDKLKFRIGFLFEAGCQNPAGDCEKDYIYVSDKVKIARVINENPDGSTYVNPYGNFYKDGEKISAVGVNILSPNLQDRNLNESEKQQLASIMDTVQYE
jgi:hypothetical protein